MNAAKLDDTKTPIAAAEPGRAWGECSPAGCLAELDRRNLARHVVRVIHEGNRAQADVLLIQVNGQVAAVKDYQNRGAWYRRTFGRFLMGREVRGLRAAAGVPGVPHFFGRLGPWACVIEYVPGPTCRQLAVGELEPRFFEELNATVAHLREQGVLHNDLKHDTNIIVGPGGQPWIVDFAGSLQQAPWWRPFWRWLYSLYEADDRKAVIKLKLCHRPDLVTPEEQQFLEQRGPLERFVRRARMGIKRLAKSLVRSEPRA